MMATDWRRLAMATLITLVIVSTITVSMAVADRGDKHFGRGDGWKGGNWDKNWRHNDWDRDRWQPGYYGSGSYSSGYYSSGYYSPQAYSYPVAVPVPVYVPVNYGGNPDACYQACMASGYYSPNQCARSCFPAY